MAEYIICEISPKNKVEILEVISREDYEKLRETLDFITRSKEELRDIDNTTAKGRQEIEDKWKYVEEKVVKMYPNMTVFDLQRRYGKAFILNHDKLML